MLEGVHAPVDHDVQGCLRVTYPDGRVCVFGDTDSPGVEDDDGTAKHGGRTISLKVYDWWFFVRVALEYDLGLARYLHSRACGPMYPSCLVQPPMPLLRR